MGNQKIVLIAGFAQYGSNRGGISPMFSFMLVDETATLKLCPNCYKAFFAETADDVYCSTECEMKDQQ